MGAFFCEIDNKVEGSILFFSGFICYIPDQKTQKFQSSMLKAIGAISKVANNLELKNTKAYVSNIN